MPKHFEIEVEKVNGYCACGYKEGDVFACEGLNTPEKPFCGGAYAILFPMQTALHSGAAFGFEKNPHCKTKLACPDNGYVIFKITLLDENGTDTPRRNNEQHVERAGGGHNAVHAGRTAEGSESYKAEHE